MKCIEKQLEAYDAGLGREEDEIIKADLKLIKELSEQIRNSRERLYMEKIISTFCEIIEIQRDIISRSDYADAVAAGYGPSETVMSYVSSIVKESRGDTTVFAEDTPLPSCLPISDEFKTDNEVRKAFSNYLTHYAVKVTKSKEKKPLSPNTIYDYCSKINKLWGAFYAEWKAGKLDGKIFLPENEILPSSTFVNAYRFLQLLNRYLELKGEELKARESETVEDDPLGNPKILGNTVAALAKFTEFYRFVEERIHP